MAYTCTGGCIRVQHFSNPEVSYAGQPTGVPDYADNALALADTAPMVATWRASAAARAADLPERPDATCHRPRPHRPELERQRAGRRLSNSSAPTTAARASP
jgi:hypothetical protein